MNPGAEPRHDLRTRGRAIAALLPPGGVEGVWFARPNAQGETELEWALGGLREDGIEATPEVVLMAPFPAATLRLRGSGSRDQRARRPTISWWVPACGGPRIQAVGDRLELHRADGDGVLIYTLRPEVGPRDDADGEQPVEWRAEESEGLLHIHGRLGTGAGSSGDGETPVLLGVAGGGSEAEALRALASIEYSGAQSRRMETEREELRSRHLSLEWSGGSEDERVERWKVWLATAVLVLGDGGTAGGRDRSPWKRSSGPGPGSRPPATPKRGLVLSGLLASRGAILGRSLRSPARATPEEAGWVGLGALAMGRFDLAEAALGSVIAPESNRAATESRAVRPPASALLLAAWLSLWTGRLPSIDGWVAWVAEGLETAAGANLSSPEGGSPGRQGDLLSFARGELVQALEGLGRGDVLEGVTTTSAPPPSSSPFPAAPPHPDAAKETDDFHSFLGPSPFPEAGYRLAHLVFGRLGARADARFGRLRLAPVLPFQLPVFTIRNLRVGDARLSVDYHEAGGRHSLLFQPSGGRTPLNLVLEPRFPLKEVERIQLDGEDVDVEEFSWSGGTGVRLQLPLDRNRRLIVDGIHDE